MKNALRAEFRKLLTVRSTYVLTVVAFVFVSIGTFYGSGFKSEVYDQHFLVKATLPTAGVVSFFVAIISVLLMAHEYRYNTILYTLTLNKSRTKVLLAKLTTALSLSMLVTFAAIIASIGLSILGAKFSGHHLPAQDFNFVVVLAKSLFYCSGFALAGLLFAFLIRNITATVAALFLIPNTVEQLLGLLLKHNAVYLPFSALGHVNAPPAPAPIPSSESAAHGAVVFLIYLVVGWLVAWRLFLKRDAQ